MAHNNVSAASGRAVVPNPAPAPVKEHGNRDLRKNKYYVESLPHTREEVLKLYKEQLAGKNPLRAALDASAMKFQCHITIANTQLDALNRDTQLNYTPNPNSVLLVIPTGNKFKTELLKTRYETEAAKLSHISLEILTVKANSGVGEQPYDEAGPKGAINRVVNALGALLKSDSKHRTLLSDKRIGTVMVGAVENFMKREMTSVMVREPGQKGKVEWVPSGAVDYGVIALCRFPLVRGQAPRWEYGVSEGVVAPWKFVVEAMKLGFQDQGAGSLQGEVTMGEVLEDNTGIDKADWHEFLAGKSRYVILRERMNGTNGVKGMKVPWPEAKGGAGAGAGAGAKTGPGVNNGGKGVKTVNTAAKVQAANTPATKAETQKASTNGGGKKAATNDQNGTGTGNVKVAGTAATAVAKLKQNVGSETGEAGTGQPKKV